MSLNQVFIIHCHSYRWKNYLQEFYIIINLFSTSFYYKVIIFNDFRQWKFINYHIFLHHVFHLIIFNSSLLLLCINIKYHWLMTFMLWLFLFHLLQNSKIEINLFKTHMNWVYIFLKLNETIEILFVIWILGRWTQKSRLS